MLKNIRRKSKMMQKDQKSDKYKKELKPLVKFVISVIWHRIYCRIYPFYR